MSHRFWRGFSEVFKASVPHEANAAWLKMTGYFLELGL